MHIKQKTQYTLTILAKYSQTSIIRGSWGYNQILRPKTSDNRDLRVVITTRGYQWDMTLSLYHAVGFLVNKVSGNGSKIRSL